MTDIDITAAIEAAKDTLLESPALGCGCCAWPDDLYESREEQAATEAITAALPHILARVEARVKPSREELIALLYREFCSFLAYSPHNRERFWGQPADAVLALLPGKTEQEVREEVAREHEEKMDRLLEGEWQAGYVAGNNDQLNGTICGRRRAANEGIARGGEQG